MWVVALVFAATVKPQVRSGRPAGMMLGMAMWFAMPSEKPTPAYQPQAQQPKRSLRILAAATLCGAIMFLAALAFTVVLVGRIFPSPGRWSGVLIAIDLAVPGALAYYTFESILRHPWPRR